MEGMQKAEKTFNESIKEENSKISNLDKKILLFDNQSLFSERYLKMISNNSLNNSKKTNLKNTIIYKTDTNKKKSEPKVNKYISVKSFGGYQFNSLYSKKEKNFFKVYDQISEMQKKKIKEMNKINKILNSRKNKYLFGLIDDLNENLTSSCEKEKEVNFPLLNYNYSQKPVKNTLNRSKFFNSNFSITNTDKKNCKGNSFFDKSLTEGKMKRELTRKFEFKNNLCLSDVYCISKSVIDSLIKHQMDKNSRFIINKDKTKNLDKYRSVIKFKKQDKNSSNFLSNKKIKCNNSDFNHFMTSAFMNEFGGINNNNVNNFKNEGLIIRNLSNYKNIITC